MKNTLLDYEFIVFTSPYSNEIVAGVEAQKGKHFTALCYFKVVKHKKLKIQNYIPNINASL